MPKPVNVSVNKVIDKAYWIGHDLYMEYGDGTVARYLNAEIKKETVSHSAHSASGLTLLVRKELHHELFEPLDAKPEVC